MTRFHKVARLAATALLALVTLNPITAQAQVANEAPLVLGVDAHADLFDAIYSGVDQEQLLETMLRQISAQVVASRPEAAAMEVQAPGLLEEMMLALRPVLRDYRDRVRQQYDPQLIDVMRTVFTVEEATSLAQLYRSDLGRRMMGFYAGNVSMNQTVDQALDKQEITTDALAADDGVSVNRSVGALVAAATPSELQEMADLPRRYPALLKMPQFMQRTLPIRAEMENAPPTPAEERAIQQGIAEAFAKYQERETN